MDNENSEAEVSPGMIAQVDIIRGRRSILEYFWQPVAKIKETAFKEEHKNYKVNNSVIVTVMLETIVVMVIAAALSLENVL